jgi:hypothetical protein
VVFIPQKTPIVELTPSMVIGIVLQGYKQYSIVASLTKEFNSFYSNSAQIKQDTLLSAKKQWFLNLSEEFDAAMQAFKQMQRTYPQVVIVYRLVDSFERSALNYDAEHLLLSSELAVKHKVNPNLRKTSLTYLLTQDIEPNEFFQSNASCKYFSIDGPGKSFQSVKRGCVIDHNEHTFSLMVQDR